MARPTRSRRSRRRLKKPGKAVAVIELRSLLAEGGVLEQLRARGFKVDHAGGVPRLTA
jgi:hypothetical protein